MLRQTCYRRSGIIYGLLGLFICICMSLIATPQVSALSGSGPDPADMGAVAGDNDSFVVSSAGYPPVSIPNTTALIYFSENTSVKTVRIYDANVCTSPLNSAPGGGNQRDRPAPGTDADPIPPNGTHMTDYYVQSMDNANTSAVVSGVASNASNCYNASPLTITIPNNTLRFDSGSNRYRAQFVASIDGGWSGIQNRFNITIDQGGIVGYSAAGQPDPFGIARDYPYSGYRNYELPFAPDCSVKGTPKTATIQLYDLDNGDAAVQNGTFMTTYLQEYTAAGAFVQNVPFSRIYGAGSSFSTGASNTYTIKSGSNQYVNLDFTVRAGYKYKLNMTNVYYVNVLQFRLPYDSIYYLTGCSPPTTVSCGPLITDPKYPEPGQNVSMDGSVNYSGGPPTPNIVGPSMSVTPGPGAITPSVTDSGSIVHLATTQKLNAATGYTVNWSVEINGISKSCSGTFQVASKPFFSVLGGDIATGASIASPGPTGPVGCSVAPKIPLAGIVSWNNDGTPGFGGAGGQYAAYAMNFIQDFVTNQANGGSKDWSFSNQNTASGGRNSVDIGNGFFGGMFGSAPCADYWNDHPTPAVALPSGPISTWADGDYYVDASASAISLPAQVIPAGRHVTLYIDGNVSLAGDITYQGGTYTDRNDIPSFKLIVHGVIYIDNSVRNLDGFYAAIPDASYSTLSQSLASPRAGTITTCSNGFAPINPLGAGVNMRVSCGNSLTVNGAVAANQLWLLRTSGTLSTYSPAETFDYTPEVWLAPASGGTGIDTNQNYQSVVGLPPVL